MKPNKKADWATAISAASGTGFTLLGCIGLGIFLGHLVEIWLDVGPWGMAVGGIIGALAGFYSIFRQIADSAGE